MGISGLDSFGGSYSAVSLKAEVYTQAALLEQKPADKAAALGRVATSSAIVTLSPLAKRAAAQAAPLSFEDVGMSARAKLDALKQQASEKTHTPVNRINVQQAGLLDYSGFSDQELAAMAKNSSKNFSVAERDHAQGVLADRVKVSVEAYAGPAVAGDWRAHGKAINALYGSMSPEVRSALGWTPAMLEANNRMVEDDERKYGPLGLDKLLTTLWAAQYNGGLAFQRAA